MPTKTSTDRSKMALRTRVPTRRPFPVDDELSDDDDSSHERQQRELMRPWLLRQINKGGIPGLQWHNKERTMVKIPWTHGSRQGFDVKKDACLFKRWAMHTGKYKDGDQCNPKKWKANFRCAMNSLHDVEEVKIMSKSRGHNAFKIYRFLSERKTPRKEQKKKEKQTTQEDYYRQYTTNADRQEMLRKVREKVQKQQKERAISDLSMRSGPSDTSDYCSGSDETESIGSDSSLSPQMSVSSGISTVDETPRQCSYQEHSYATKESPIPSPQSGSIPSFVEEMRDPVFPSHTSASCSVASSPHLNYTSSYSANHMPSQMYYSQTGYDDAALNEILQQRITEEDVRSLIATSQATADSGWNSSAGSSIFSTSQSSSMSELLNSPDHCTNYSNYPNGNHESEFIVSDLRRGLISHNENVAVAYCDSTYASTYTAQYEHGEQRLMDFKEY